MSKKHFSLAKSLITFDLADMPEIAHEDFVELVNDTDIKLESPSFRNSILVS